MQPFPPATVASASGPKNYVFVDEHNRHKRLKVMRACEGCRRRKIKCDAATTNSWPCAACKRLKLTCVPPIGGIDTDMGAVAGEDPTDYHMQTQMPQQYMSSAESYPAGFIPNADYYNQYQGYGAPSSQHMYAAHEFDRGSSGPGDGQRGQPPMHPMYGQRFSSFDSTDNPASAASPQSIESVTAEELAETLGDLNIAGSGIAPYIRQQGPSRHEAPAPIVDDEEDLPALPTVAGSQVRIPPSLMPSDDDASAAFSAFFRNVHPYVPVLCRSAFYQQWRQDRNSISPLLLEAVLACAGQVSDDPTGGSQWLALANRHEENFADQPRLSTIQALLLILKAREKTPKKGYYYRSWVTTKKIVAMAKDLELHEHHEMHQAGEDCGSSSIDCLCKTRIWQLAMVCEVMVGGPQGRSDYGVDSASVDVSTTPPNYDIDEYEKAISRQFAYWVKNIRNIRGLTAAYHMLKRVNKDWATDPKFVAHAEEFRKWPSEIPSDLRIDMPQDGRLPKIQSHFIGNMHTHFHLAIVMFYKPQLQASKDFANDEKWKYFMTLCYTSAKQVCCLQEAILQDFDILGLACMMRGLSFPIYSILTCIMIHLIAITSPDLAFNTDARGYFIRHMRVLERCIAEWPMPEVETQIYGLRAAFSADLDKPFDLKPSFPYSSSSEHSKSPSERHLDSNTQQNMMPIYQQRDSQQGNFFPTPPVSDGSSTQNPTPQFYNPDYNNMARPQQLQGIPPTSHPNHVITPAEQWNPTPIIDQFSNAFAIPQSALAPPPSASSYGSSPPLTIPQQPHGMTGQIQTPQFMPSPNSAGGYSVHSHSFTPPQHNQQLPAKHGPYMNPHAQTSQHSLHAGPVSVPTLQTPQGPYMNPHAQSSSHSLHQSTPQPRDAASSYFDPSLHQHQGPPPTSQPQAHLSAAGQQQAYAAQAQIYPPGTVATATTAGDSPTAVAGGVNANVTHMPVYVTPKEWQQSVASVFDPQGLKRKWDYEQQMAMQGGRQGHGGPYGHARMG